MCVFTCVFANERLGWVLYQYKRHLSFAESISYHANFRFQFSTFPEGTGICVIIFSIQHVMSLCNISCNLFQLILSPFLGPETLWMPSPWLSLKNYKIYPSCNLCNIFCKHTGMWTYCDLEFRLNNENLYFIFILCSVPFLSWLFNKTTGPNHWTNRQL